jgi:low temperature requirement protein LtrA
MSHNAQVSYVAFFSFVTAMLLFWVYAYQFHYNLTCCTKWGVLTTTQASI